MPTNEELPIPEPDPRMDRFIKRSSHAVGATDRMPVRVIVLFAAIVICISVAPPPFSLIGVVAVMLLAIDNATNRIRR